MKILILEAETPQLVDAARAKGQQTNAGHYTAALKFRSPGLNIHVAEPYRQPLTQQDLAGVDGVVFTGAGVAWSTDAPQAAALRAAGEMVFGAGIPTIGSCNGLQLATVLLGGTVGPSPKGMEIGLAQGIQITDAGRTHPMMQGRRDGYAVPCIHRDEVQRLPDGAVLIASNAHSPVQAMSYCANGVDFWGMQYHPELSATAISGYVEAGFFAQGANLANDLRLAETDADAAKRLGGMPEDLCALTRTTELANWLAHLQK
jgi:GMP synthase (glutamine-hydrolysing)